MRIPNRLSDWNINLFGGRIQIGVDLDCPGIGFIWHRCSTELHAELFPFYASFYYGKDDSEDDPDVPISPVLHPWIRGT